MNPTLQNAIKAWVVAATGLSRVIWTKQGGPRPAVPYATLDFPSVTPLGRGWTSLAPAAVPSDGADVEYFARSQDVAVLKIQIFGETGANAVGTTSPATLMKLVVDKSRLPTIKTALQAAKIGIASFGTIQSLSGMINTVDLEPRAELEVRINLKSEVSELGTQIKTAEMTGEIHDTTISTTVTTEE